ncbi:MAG TPA: hypothetical protein PK926_00890 [Spirochaetota bacterium]|nr:hypothetical protein [Spirochaetota bacterium]HPI87904.1 hypothetical protein [Spirochaetota bacterium]HPR47364.1 hypothetical protein [Spirochaetota bacterium]
MTRLIKTAVMLLVVTLALLALRADDARAPKRVLVLGFTAPIFDDIQERYFRETLIRKLFEQGMDVVPVMEIESLFQGEAPPRIKNAAPGETENRCKEMKAGFALSGKIEVKDPGAVQKGEYEYACEVAVFCLADRTVKKLSVTGNTKTDLHGFITRLCSEIAITFSAQFGTITGSSGIY